MFFYFSKGRQCRTVQRSRWTKCHPDDAVLEDSKEDQYIGGNHSLLFYVPVIIYPPISNIHVVIFILLSQVSLGVALCSTRSEACKSHVVIMSEAKIEIGPCLSDVTLPVMTRPADTPSRCMDELRKTNSFCKCDV